VLDTRKTDCRLSIDWLIAEDLTLGKDFGGSHLNCEDDISVSK
jgi:hypothetical protein